MDDTKIFYSDEAIKLFAKKPPILIRFGYIVIILFLIVLTTAGSLLYVPYTLLDTQICEKDNGKFIFENKIKASPLTTYSIIINEENRIKINSYTYIHRNNTTYVQFELNEEQARSLEQSDTYKIEFNISLVKSYLNYLFNGI